MKIKLLPLFVIIFSLQSCSETNCTFKNEYSLAWSKTDIEVFELSNSEYIDLNNSILEGQFDKANILNSNSPISVWETQFLFSNIKFNEDNTGELTEWNTDQVFDFTYEKSSDKIIVKNQGYDWDFVYDLKDDCKIENCTYVITTKKANPFELNYIFALSCSDMSYQEIAKEFLLRYEQKAPDTIGIFEIVHIEN